MEKIDQIHGMGVGTGNLKIDKAIIENWLNNCKNII